MRSTVAAITALALSSSVVASTVRQYPTRDNAKTISLPLWNHDDNKYLANITVGTPPQTVTVLIDTGSSDLYVYADDNKCDVPGGCNGGSFKSSSSNTFKMLQQGTFDEKFGDGSHVVGDYITETVSIGGAKITNMTMGYIHRTTEPLEAWGVMGIAFPPTEVAADFKDDVEYWNLPYWMTAQGLINEPVFSLYLDDIDSQGSTLLFGGVDTSKYNGDLTVFPAFPDGLTDDGGYEFDHYNVALTAMGAVDSKGTHSSFQTGGKPIRAIIDSGAETLRLPTEMVEDIWNQLGTTYNDDVGNLIPCSAAARDITLVFQINGNSGILIGAPLAEFITPFPSYGKQPPKVNGADACKLQITSTTGNTYSLGQPFLRSAYVLFDPGHAEIAIAQAKPGVKDSKIVPVAAAASWPASAGLLPKSVVGQGVQSGFANIPGKTIGFDVITSGIVAQPTGDSGDSAASSSSGASATGIQGGTSIPGIAAAYQTHAPPLAASNKIQTPAVPTAGASTGGSAAAGETSKAAAAGLAPPAMGSLLGGCAVLMLAGLSGAAVVFTGV